MLEMQSYSILLFLLTFPSSSPRCQVVELYVVILYHFTNLTFGTYLLIFPLPGILYVFLLVILEDDCEDDLGSRAVAHDLFLSKPSFCIVMAGWHDSFKCCKWKVKQYLPLGSFMFCFVKKVNTLLYTVKLLFSFFQRLPFSRRVFHSAENFMMNKMSIINITGTPKQRRELY